MDMEAEISRAAALIAQGLSLNERVELADAIKGISTLEEIPEKYKEQILTMIQQKQAKNL